MPEKIYNTAVANLGQHLTLDPSVAFEVGCAEAVSKVLQLAGVQGIPQRGYAGTDDLFQWLKVNKNFVQTAQPQWGGIVVSPTIGSNHGHCGIILKRGIASNDSSNGKFNENYSVDSWVNVFENKGLATYYFCYCV